MVYVLSKNGQPIMPTKNHAKVRLLLNSGKAKVVKRTPFTIQLIGTSKTYVQDITLGVDAGSRHVGLSATTTKDGTVKQKTSYIGKLDYVKNTFPWMRNSSLDALMFENVIINHQTAWKNCKDRHQGIPQFHKKSYEGTYQTNGQYKPINKHSGIN